MKHFEWVSEHIRITTFGYFPWCDRVDTKFGRRCGLSSEVSRTLVPGGASANAVA